MATKTNPAPAWQCLIAPAAVCIYVLAFAAPFKFDLPLLLLAILGTFAVAMNYRQPGPPSSPLHKALWLFLAIYGVSIISSVDPQRSFTLGLAVLPGIAIFLLLANYFPQEKMLGWVLVAHAALALALGTGLLASLWQRNWVVPPGYENWIAEMNSPIFIVSNDAIFLALLAPLSVAVLLTNSSRTQKVIAALALLATTILTGLMQSRMMAAVLLLTLTALAFLIRPRMAVPVSMAVLTVVSLLDAARGFPLYSRFLQLHEPGGSIWWDARIPIWGTGWKMFLGRPWLGQGLRTFHYVSADNIQVNWVHNLYLETLAEQGIVGLAALAILLGSILAIGIGNFQRAAGEQRIIAATLLTLTIGILFAGIFEISFARQWVNELVFFTAGATALLHRFIGKPGTAA